MRWTNGSNYDIVILRTTQFVRHHGGDPSTIPRWKLLRNVPVFFLNIYLQRGYNYQFNSTIDDIDAGRIKRLSLPSQQSRIEIDYLKSIEIVIAFSGMSLTPCSRLPRTNANLNLRFLVVDSIYGGKGRQKCRTITASLMTVEGKLRGIHQSSRSQIQTWERDDPR